MKAALTCAIACLFVAAPAWGGNDLAWRGDAGNAQHIAKAPAAGQALAKIHWQMAVDLAPRVHGKPQGEILIHYASPMITAKNTVLVPVKTTANGAFEVEAVKGTTGNQIWTPTTDYVLPP